MSSLALVVLLLPLAGSLVMHLSTCQVQHQRVAQIPPAQTRSCSTPLMRTGASSAPQPTRLWLSNLDESHVKHM